ncbi:DNA mismatch repair protein MutS [Mesonia sp. MT50]|uniref:DNA mismatch repair protein MutS n=1 Tax=Mesonia profundi TaxID=3070998 RepID=A0ABU1A062_9FLAO|nr:DNA mismatch repair protein MutS [Mesonia profundi]MDQ7917092.1 DNA mismatch repair protein MutS [Mesonia profundi]
MQNPHTTYSSYILTYSYQLKKLKQQLIASSMLRLVLFLLFAFLIYHFFGNTKLVIGFVIGAIIGFIFLVSRHATLQQKKKKLEALIGINETEIKVLNRDFQELPTGEEFANSLHHFSQDIDLFGNRSFFQYLNRSALASGKKKLAQLLTSNHISFIPKKQNAIQELAEKIKFRQEFSAVAQLVKVETSTHTILNWLKQYQTFVPSFISWLPKVFSVLSLAVIAAYFTDFISGYVLLGWMILGLVITSKYLKNINELSSRVSKVQETFRQYYQLLALLEQEEFSGDLLKQEKEKIINDQHKASQTLKRFSKAIDALDQRNNLLFGVFGNGFLLWDLQQSLKLERWIVNHRQEVDEWFQVIDFFDAYNSLGNYALNHQEYVFPNINEDQDILKTTQAVHPLIDPEEAVTNDYQIKKEEFFIITGANMAGKSTFLRTVSLQIMMANVGLPVCAKTCDYSPIKLITSMRTVDSLADEASYFFSELTRLKFIVEEIKTDRYFIILDEILKGTNSTDKAIGSRKFIEKLVGSHSSGIIATHDLSLCEVSEELSQVKNHYFDAEILNNELFFDYKFKNGICQNMNASFLLKKMEIVD